MIDYNQTVIESSWRRRALIRSGDAVSYQMDISAELKAWRHADPLKNGRGYFTQVEAANFLGVPMKTYIDWEQGRRGPLGIALTAVTQRIRKKPTRRTRRR